MVRERRPALGCEEWADSPRDHPSANLPGCGDGYLVTMSRRRVVCCAALGLAAVSGAACHAHSPSAHGATQAADAADSVRGVLTLVGNDPLSVLLLTPSVGASREPLALDGSAVHDALRHAVGLEIVVFGKRTGARAAAGTPRGAPVFDVQRFFVRSADGVAATDGVLISTDNGFALRLVDGRTVPVAALPMSLHRMIGARVWLAGALTTAPQAYGVIREPR